MCNCNNAKCAEHVQDLLAQLTEAQSTIKHLRGKAEFSMPADMQGRFYNGSCTDPCDMVDGPCTCGAYHNVKEWLGKLVKRIDQLQSQLAAEKENAIHHQNAHKVCSEDRVEAIKQLAAEQKKVKGLRDGIQARRQWQSCPRCSKTFATQT